MLEIIFEDEFIIVCKKPPGIPTQTPKSGVTDMVSLLKNYRVSKGEPHYVGLVHRLDQPVLPYFLSPMIGCPAWASCTRIW